MPSRRTSSAPATMRMDEVGREAHQEEGAVVGLGF